MIFQWGTGGTASKTVTFEFPITFNTLQCFVSGAAGTSGDNGAWWGTFGYNMTITGATCKCNASSRCRYLAIGY